MNENIFHAYDVRGTYPETINEDIAKKIAGAYAKFIEPEGTYVTKPAKTKPIPAEPKTIAVGCDVRLSSPSLKKAVIEGLTEAGINVIDIGTVPTEVMYFAVGSLGLDGGLQVSASHNPKEYNGIKMVGKNVTAIALETGLNKIRDWCLAEPVYLFKSETKGSVTTKDLVGDYVSHLASMVDLSKLSKQKIVANNNFGMSGPIAKAVLEKMNAPIELIDLNFEPDGSFPKGAPDPLLKTNSQETSARIISEKADLGVAWDADGDRFFAFDEHGQILNGAFVTALLSSQLLGKNPGEKILYDPRIIWAVEDSVKASGGIPVVTVSGHSNIKNRMKAENALFAGELSGHYFYRDFYCADNGILSFLHFLELLANSEKTVAQLADQFRSKYFTPGEINFKSTDNNQILKDIKAAFADGQEENMDGLSISYSDWRLNIRVSNTQPLLRLNIEAKSQAVLDERLEEVKAIIERHATLVD